MAELIKARQLREQRKKIIIDAQALANKEGVTADELANVDRMILDEKRMKAEIDRLEALDASAAEFRTNAPPNEQIAGQLTEEQREKQEETAYSKAWINWLKYGWDAKPNTRGQRFRGISTKEKEILNNYADMQRRAFLASFTDSAIGEQELRSLFETRDMGTGGGGAYPGATSGFFVPVGFTNAIVEALKYYGPMLAGGMDDPEIFETSTGQPLPFPTDNDTTITGELIGENQQVTGQDVNIGQIVMGAYKYSTRIVKVSLELLQDSAFALEPYLIKKFAIRLGRILNTNFTTGTGTNQPTGIVTKAVQAQLPFGSGTTYTAVGSSGNSGNADGTNTIGSDDLTVLEHSIDILYRRGAKYMMHDTTLRSIKTIKDKFGRPLWLPGLASKEPDTILQHEYLINNDMDQLQTQASSPPVVRKTVLFGQMPLFKIRRVKEMSVIRLDERFADYGQVAFLGFARYDSALMDAGTHPVAYLANSY